MVAMSGGVDSSVAAIILKEQGYEVAGAYMKNWINEESIEAFCPWQKDIEDARTVAEKLDIPFQVGNFIHDYRKRIVEYLVEGYRRGITPNPDVMCNREMKFGVFLDWALDQGFDAVATGHYCRRDTTAKGNCDILEGTDKNKDQSYFLAMVTQAQMQNALFPIGHLTKPQVREYALKYDLPNATKKDSQGICFIGEVKINDFLKHYIPDSPGPIINTVGDVLGKHKGLHRYTLGQRRGIGIPSNTDNEFFVVVGKDLKKNALIIAFESLDAPGLYQSRMHLHHLSFINESISEACQILAKPRYRDPSQVITYIPEAGNTARIEFDKPQRALAKGQVCALYKGEKLLGGGIYF